MTASTLPTGTNHRINPIERWENPIKQRYYMVYISQDLIGDYVVTRIWGKKGQPIGKILHTPCFSHKDALDMLESIRKKRLCRGYKPIRLSG